jgi:16S rRNA (cytosine967-C5)-methyltransferase
MTDPRQVAFWVLCDVYRHGAYADVALDKRLQHAELSEADRRLTTEIAYGCVRQQRSLDTIIDRLAQKNADRQPPELRTILHIGLYQLHYIDRIPAAAAVDTTVKLAKANRLTGLAGFVNGLLRRYSRLQAEGKPIEDILQLPSHPVARTGILYSYPDWMVENWQQQIGIAETEQLCAFCNQSPALHLRINRLRTTIEAVESALQAAGIESVRVPHVPSALKLASGVGDVRQLPGFKEAWWTVQDSSAQLVSVLLDPQPGEVIVDACAAPGGKTTHIAELMHDTGTIWACDRIASRLKKVKQNADRLQLQSIQILEGDSRDFPQFQQQCDRVLLDAPCSGLGTLHRRADLRWRQTPEKTQELTTLQSELLAQAATWVKPNGVLVYATCTLHPPENQEVIASFLDRHPTWAIEPPSLDSPLHRFATPGGWMQVWPHRHQMDGFFMARLRNH